MSTKYIQNKIRHYRNLANLKQTELAQLLGFIHEDRICHWEKGVAFPSITNMFKMCKIFKVKPHELYEGYYEEIVNPDLHD